METALMIDPPPHRACQSRRQTPTLTPRARRDGVGDSTGGSTFSMPSCSVRQTCMPAASVEHCTARPSRDRSRRRTALLMLAVSSRCLLRQSVIRLCVRRYTATFLTCDGAAWCAALVRGWRGLVWVERVGVGRECTSRSRRRCGSLTVTTWCRSAAVADGGRRW